MLFVQILKQQTLNDLVGGRDACQYINEEPIPVALALTVKDIEVHMGSFKVATKGFCTPSLFGGKPTVSAKQAYLAADRHGKAWTLDNPPEKPEILGFGQQQLKLKTELKAIAWGSALLNYVYEFIKMKKQDTVIDIPEFRFVKAALGTEGQEVLENQRQLYLLEEFIETDPYGQGAFRKYVNNANAKPLGGLNSVNRRRARFLCFTQHVQYMMTGKLAFVSDYQGKFKILVPDTDLLTVGIGGDSLLTDPQIMTDGYDLIVVAYEKLITFNSNLGHMFGDGNIPGVFRKFETQHQCIDNEFCNAFGITKIFDKDTLSVKSAGFNVTG